MRGGSGSIAEYLNGLSVCKLPISGSVRGASVISFMRFGFTSVRVRVCRLCVCAHRGDGATDRSACGGRASAVGGTATNGTEPSINSLYQDAYARLRARRWFCGRSVDPKAMAGARTQTHTHAYVYKYAFSATPFDYYITWSEPVRLLRHEIYT